LKFKSKNSKKIIVSIIGYALYEPQFQTIILYFPKKTIYSLSYTKIIDYVNQGFKCKWAVGTLPTAACRGECPHSPPMLSLNPWFT